MNFSRLTVALLAFAVVVVAQNKRFEVASLKIAPPRSGEAGFTRFNETKGRLTVSNVRVRVLICRAYSLNDQDLSGMPGWNDDTPYDLVATFAVASTPEDVDEMLKNLLAERLQLRLHDEVKQAKGYGLIIDAKGPRLNPSQAEKPHLQVDRNRGHLLGIGSSTGALAGVLAYTMNQPVADLTNLQGAYDFELNWAPETADLAVTASDRPSIFVAVTEQLGLKLKPQQVPVKYLVIDRIQREPKEAY